MFFLQLSGVPGSGKSTLALEIAKRIDGVVIVDHDVTKSAVILSGIDEKTAGKAAYDVDYAYVNYYLSQGHNVIMDSPCFYDVQLERSLDAAETNGAFYKYVECYCGDLDEIDKRLKSRNGKISQWKSVDSHKSLFSEWLDNMKKPRSGYIVVDTSKPIESYIDEVIAYLSKDL